MIFCLSVSVFFGSSLACSDVNKRFDPIYQHSMERTIFAKKCIDVGYLDSVYLKSPIYRTQVDVTRIKVSDEKERTKLFEDAMAAYVAQAATKYPTAPKNFQFQSFVDAHLVKLGELGTGLLMQYVVPGHRVQIVVAQISKNSL